MALWYHDQFVGIMEMKRRIEVRLEVLPDDETHVYHSTLVLENTLQLVMLRGHIN